MPVYSPDGQLQAVIGTDLFLDEVETYLRKSQVEGESLLLVDQNGHAAIAPLVERFPMAEADWTGDLRASQTELLAAIVSDALEGKETGVQQGQLQNGAYYISAAPIKTTGWILVTAYSKEMASQPVAMLQQSYSQIEEETTLAYRSSTNRSRQTAIVLLLVVAGLMLTGSIILGTRIVKPLNTITRRISQLSEDNLEFKMEDAYRTGDEVEELARSFAAISHKTVEYLDTSFQKHTKEYRGVSAQVIQHEIDHCRGIII